MFNQESYEKIFENIFEVPWDLFGGGRGSNLTLLHSKISPNGDFNHLWYEELHHGSRFSGLHFCSELLFGSGVTNMSVSRK